MISIRKMTKLCLISILLSSLLLTNSRCASGSDAVQVSDKHISADANNVESKKRPIGNFENVVKSGVNSDKANEELNRLSHETPKQEDTIAKRDTVIEPNIVSLQQMQMLLYAQNRSVIHKMFKKIWNIHLNTLNISETKFISHKFEKFYS